MRNYLFDIIFELKKNDVDFIICGGVACVLQGCERTTFDIDLNILTERNNLIKAIDVFKKMNFSPRIPEPFESFLDENKRKQWIEEKDAFVYTIVSENGLMQIDIFLKYPINYSELKQNADSFIIEGQDIPVSSKTDLIKAKEAVSPIRDKDVLDIQMLKELLDHEKDNNQRKL